MRWGRSIGVVAAVFSVAAFACMSASASGVTPPAATAQAVVIAQPGTPPSGSPAATTSGTPSVTVTDWSSSADQPLVTLGSGVSNAASQDGLNSGSIQLTNLAVFGGEIQLQSLDLAASTGSRTITLTAEGLLIDGTATDLPAPGQSAPLGDWGTLTAGYTHRGTLRRTVIGLVVTLSADHDGLPAGSSIDIGTLELALQPASSGGGGGGGKSTGTGSGQDSGGRPPSSKHHHHHAGHAKARHQHHAKGHHRHQAVKVHHPDHLPQLGRGLRGRVVEAAAEQIGWPYVWGGESRAEGGFDCSGLVDYAYAAAGHPLPGRPTAAVLWQMGIPITVDQLRPGDLVFLGAPSGNPYHVALYAGHGMIIVASGRGRPIALEPLDSAPWDGYARIWAPGAGHLLKRAPWLTAAVQTRRARIGLRSDAIAAARAAQAPPKPAPAKTAVQAPAPAPQPDPTAEHGTSLITVADLRLRSQFGVRASLGLPTA